MSNTFLNDNQIPAHEMFDLSKREYEKHRHSFKPFYTVKKELHKCSVLYFDGDDGVCMFSKPSEVFDTSGFAMQLVDCGYCDIASKDMLKIVAILDDFEIDYDSLEE